MEAQEVLQGKSGREERSANVGSMVTVVIIKMFVHLILMKLLYWNARGIAAEIVALMDLMVSLDLPRRLV